MSQRGAEKLIQSKFTFGVNAAAMAGPVGRSAAAETDAQMHAEILSYSRSRGVFAGIVLKGSTLRPDDHDNRKLYGKPVTHRQILNLEVPAPESAKALTHVLNKYSPAQAK
jgi:lipid-binding SYLF domain-containing protein